MIRSLARSGHEVVAIAPYDEYADKLSAMGCYYRPLPMDNKGTSPFRDLLLFARICVILLREQPQVCLLYTVKPNIYGSFASHLLGIRVINNVAGLGIVFSKDDWLSKLVSLMYRFALPFSGGVFFQNKDDHMLFLGKGLVRQEDSYCLPGSGIDLVHFALSPKSGSEISERQFKFLLSCRMLWEKGVGDYVEAARLVRKELGTNIEFNLLGFLDVQNPNAIPREQMDIWTEEGVIKYLGECDDVRPHIADADCVVLPSYYPEGVPRSLLEAAALGRPIITTDSVGCREVVENGVNGFICKPKDAEGLAEKMTAMIRLDEKSRRLMGEKGREKVEREFDEKIVIKRYLEEIQSLLESNKSNRLSPLQCIFWAACLLVIIFSLAPMPQTMSTLPQFDLADKVLHSMTYFGLCSVGLLAYFNRLSSVVFGLLLMGVIIELVQYATGWRYMEVEDCIANAFGILMGVGIIHILCSGQRAAPRP